MEDQVLTSLPPSDSGPRATVDRSRRYARILVILFLCTLPFVNPIVHGDGVGYYAYIRAPLIQHNLRFEEDWRHANLNFSQSRTMPSRELLPSQYTGTGYVSNQFTVGPALLWAPVLVAAHGLGAAGSETAGRSAALRKQALRSLPGKKGRDLRRLFAAI